MNLNLKTLIRGRGHVNVKFIAFDINDTNDGMYDRQQSSLFKIYDDECMLCAAVCLFSKPRL